MMIEEAIMLPGSTSFCSTSHAPVPIAAIWSATLTKRAIEAIAATRSLALTTGASASSLRRTNSRTAPSVQPMALIRFACLMMPSSVL
ncbi:hypothetical protein QNA08_16855 [Chelatococcus sp. SYSU_G07232]|uniref:Uncharacterized protein n=1 Tax=Chelatococcus albus TaxID=3047466 RepID=A0ABT7AKJ8_9HYPH|nr:hypothetical protein [Chelatococcus sp. SYSU_G07232]MDJ1159889.1 hypothetical protein [Chelatococcus sp. SYSU_G07232]